MKTTRSRSAAISKSRWTAYATAGAATALAGAGTAEAEIHHVDVNQLFSAPPGGTTYAVISAFGLGAASSAQFTMAHFLDTSSNTSSGQINGHALFAIAAPGGVSAAFVGYNTATFGSYGYVSKLNAGQYVSGFANFIPQGSYFNALARHNLGGQFRDAGAGFIGFKFNTGAGSQYGWVRVNMNGGPGNSFTLVDYAWGDVGDKVAVGAVPEPGSLGLLAIGGVGLLAWRKRRAKAVEAKA